MLVNIVFHKVVKSITSDDDKFVVSLDFYRHLVDQLFVAISKGQTRFTRIRLYFDDGDDSFTKLVLPILDPKLYPLITLSIVTDWIGKSGFLSSSDLKELSLLKVKIASHGASHAALAVSNKIADRLTPGKGKYRNRPFGFNQRLTENEVLYQLRHSRESLNKIGINSDEFVFPFGLYNSQSISINSSSEKYTILSTCDELLDVGQDLRPRILVTRSKSIPSFIRQLSEISKYE